MSGEGGRQGVVINVIVCMDSDWVVFCPVIDDSDTDLHGYIFGQVLINLYVLFDHRLGPFSLKPRVRNMAMGMLYNLY